MAGEKRDVPLTIWVTPADARELQQVVVELARQSPFPVKRAGVVYGLLQAGLAQWKANEAGLAARKRPFRPEESRPQSKRVCSRRGA
jgi:hypothetical protein